MPGLASCPTTWDIRAAMGTAETPADPIIGEQHAGDHQHGQLAAGRVHEARGMLEVHDTLCEIHRSTACFTSWPWSPLNAMTAPGTGALTIVVSPQERGGAPGTGGGDTKVAAGSCGMALGAVAAAAASGVVPDRGTVLPAGRKRA